jgi:hypothetical protein
VLPESEFDCCCMEQFTDEGCGGFDGGIVVVLMEIVVVE